MVFRGGGDDDGGNFLASGRLLSKIDIVKV